MRHSGTMFSPVTVALMAAFLLSGCAQVQPYIDKAGQAVKPLTDAAETVLENVDIKPTPEQRPEDDLG